MTFNSGPMGPMVNGHDAELLQVQKSEPAGTGPDLVAEAKAALRAFHVEDRRTAKLLLTMWKRRIQLDGAQVDEILRTYPETVDLDWEPGA